MESGYAIEAEHLTKVYGDFTAISDINIQVKNGDFMGLVGPNGAGKSTTLKAITGLLKPTSGTIRISGIDLKDHRHAMENVGCVIETPEPYPGFTPAEIMEYIGKIYGMDKREIVIRSRDVLESVKMWEWRNKSIGGFS
ncbi:MAG: ABC transporter ATP-binding protein, partial [Candidatus Methanomethylophilaceae archaeon]|nr:ABC transporter ATP-binding protein [Candidatus Methanomethylophilaceae archaeon]